jgi:hypothetical protein
MAALILRSTPFWLAGIDAKRVREEIRLDIIRYQREVVDVLYAWAQAPKVAPTTLVPAEQMTRQTPPECGDLMVNNATFLILAGQGRGIFTRYRD